MDYGYRKKLNCTVDEAESKVREALQEEGFGVLTYIDVKKTLKKKLDINTKEYRILGACNPPFAHKALEAEKEIGLLLPCNVIIYVAEDLCWVSAIDPVVAMGMIDNVALKPIAEQVRNKLRKVIDSL
ncbi:DUF302 domain-containing protein [Candidatus Woesearchaeota archaeon]|nr:MAG: DUF302 domain-containing protein [Candidatus Woesearchaeota archaeon]